MCVSAEKLWIIYERERPSRYSDVDNDSLKRF